MKVKDASEVRRLDAKRTDGSTPTRKDAPATTTDKVSTDSTAKLEAATTAAKASARSNRELRLEEIETAIKNGTFKPDPARIAARILDDAQITAQLQAMLHH